MSLASYIIDLQKTGRSYFTLQQLMAERGLSKNAALNAIFRLKKQGGLISPARGMYVIVPPKHQIDGSIPARELVPLIMEYLGARYYVALLSAGLFHGATHQKPATFQVITDKRIVHPSTFGNIKINFIYKKSVLGLPTQDIVVSTGYLKVATPELVALDMLEYPNHAGGLNHIATVFSELVESIDPVKLIHLAKNTHTEYQLQRIGYILEHIDVMDDENALKVINMLANFVQDANPHYLALASELDRKEHPRCKKWKIIENSEIESDL